jgi:hypothetical protein
MFEAIESSKDRGETLMKGNVYNIAAIAVHPKKPILAIAWASGYIILWDYEKKDYILTQ